MIEQYLPQFFLLAVFFMFVYAIVEVIKQFFKALPDKLGKWCVNGPGKKALRWFSFFIAYGMAWSFDFQFASMIFKTVNGNRAKLPQHINYFLVACLLFVGAKWIYKKMTQQYKELTEDEE